VTQLKKQFKKGDFFLRVAKGKREKMAFDCKFVLSILFN